MTNIIYMFHAIGEVLPDDWADAHYSYSKEQFEDFLSKVGKVSSIKDRLLNHNSTSVILTFDDGHISNFKAAEYLYENNIGTADFFINPLLVGNEYYMSWAQIKELHKMGMSIQSHGLDHQYLSDCSDEELYKQLLESKKQIEAHIDESVAILAPPGGRFDSRTVKIAKSIGYSCIANSIPGHVNGFSQFLLPRVAVLKQHSVDDLISMHSKFSSIIFKQKIKYRILRILKLILGNSRYEKFRTSILGVD